MIKHMRHTTGMRNHHLALGFIIFTLLFSIATAENETSTRRLTGSEAQVQKLLDKAKEYYENNDYARAANAAQEAYEKTVNVRSASFNQHVLESWLFYQQAFDEIQIENQKKKRNLFGRFSRGNKANNKTSKDKKSGFWRWGKKKDHKTKSKTSVTGYELDAEPNDTEKNVDEFNERSSQRVKEDLISNRKIDKQYRKRRTNKFSDRFKGEGKELEQYRNKKLRMSLRHFGYTNSYFPSSLFYQPSLREAKLVPVRNWYFELSYFSAKSQGKEQKNGFSSVVDSNYNRFDVGAHYGLTKQTQLTLRTGWAIVDGDLSFIDTASLTQLIPTGAAEAAIDDFDLEVTYEPRTNWVKKMISFHAPFHSFSTESNETVSLAYKLPIGDSDEYVSSGSGDISLSIRTSHELGLVPIYLDSGLHYTMVGDIDDKLFGGVVKSKDFITLDYTISREFMNQRFLGFLSAIYNTAQTKEFNSPFNSSGPFDVYANDGLNFKVGFRYNKVNKSTLFLPAFTIFMRDGDRYGFQISSDLKL